MYLSNLRNCCVLSSLLAMAFLSPSMIGSVQASEDLYEGFRNPPAVARPAVRWWWNDNRITADEIIRELDILQAAGVGGIEINPIEMLEQVENPTGTPLKWLGPEWCRLVKLAADEAKKRGMFTDIIAGTGWPFGGSFLELDETIQRVQATVTPLWGHDHYQGRIPLLSDPNRELKQLKLVYRRHQSPHGPDLMPYVQPDGTLDYHVIGGEYLMYAVTHQKAFRPVVHAAPGVEGPALDHFNPKALQRFLNRISNALGPVMGDRLGDGIRAVFCDSVELMDANWTTDFSEQFKKRRGYAIEPWLAFVLIEMAETHEGPFAQQVRRVRYDFHKTLAELLDERFYKPFHEWCKANGVLSRLQTYGWPWIRSDMIDGYMVPDIPEGDTWVYSPHDPFDHVRFAVWNKYASSGAHLTGKKLVSSEAATNLSGVFKTSLEYVKQATDLTMLAGVNHFILHGFNYSPPEAGFPGWVRFGTYFNEQNTWWPYFKHYADYTGRLCWVFQQAEPMGQIAILGPTPDLWRRPSGFDRGLFSRTPWYMHELWQALQQAGYTSDIINSTVLNKAAFKDGKIHFGTRAYEALILADVTAMTPETARAIQRYAETGGRIIYAGTVPSESPGFHDYQNKDTKVRSAIQASLKHANRVKHMTAPQRGKLLGWVQNTLTRIQVLPTVEIKPCQPRLFCKQFRDDKNRDIYFFANMHRTKEMVFEATFPTGEKTPWLWDPQTGKRFVYPNTGAKNRLSMRLGPYETLLIVYEPQLSGTTTPERVIDRSNFIEIKGPWQVTFKAASGVINKQTLPQLIDLSNDPELDTFSGTATYVTEFEVADRTRTFLDLGKVCEISEVTLNGQSIGVRWYGQHEYDLTEGLRPGKNRLEIKVTNVLFNYCRSLKDNPVAAHWIKRDSKDEPLSAGLIGPVRLCGVKK